MIMLRKMLHKLMWELYVGPQFRNFFEIRNLNFNSYIEFDECYKIQQTIKDDIISKDNYNILINYCEFINVINIKTISNKDIIESINEDDSFKDISIFNSLNNKELYLTLHNYNWQTDKQWFNYDIIRYSLYIAYYNHLKESDPNHIFVQFVEFLSKIDLYEPGLEKYISLEEYVNSLKENDYQKPIDENLFIEVEHIRCELESNKRHFNFYLD